MKIIINSDENRIEITKNAYEALNRVRSNDPTRPAMNTVYLNREDNKLTATDGRQLIQFDVSEYEINNKSELFDPVKIGKKFYLTNASNTGGLLFPRYSRVIPDLENGSYSRIYSPYKYGFNICGKISADSIMLYWILKGVDNPINVDYLLKNLKFVDNFECYSTVGEYKAVVMTFDGGLYVVMPMDKGV